MQSHYRNLLVDPLLTWFDEARRDLPWRAARGATPDPYHVLLSEIMLQQTQVSSVVPYFRRFTETFPTIQSLACADEQQVLRLWQGLGYYSRARNLLKAARIIVDRFDGAVPRTVDMLLTLPGIGRYSAGAIASIAYDTPAPIVDGNVARVLCRLDAIDADPRERNIQLRLWQTATELVPDRRAGDFNQALMELGATICTPKNPGCMCCPIQTLCQAKKLGLQDRIPQSRKTKPLPIERRWVFCIRRPDGKYLIEQRPPTGRWAGMWQFKTVVADSQVTATHIRQTCGVRVTTIQPLTTIHHTLTHRQYQFNAYVARTHSRDKTSDRTIRWADIHEMDDLPFSKPQLLIRKHLIKTEHP